MHCYAHIRMISIFSGIAACHPPVKVTHSTHMNKVWLLIITWLTCAPASVFYTTTITFIPIHVKHIASPEFTLYPCWVVALPLKNAPEVSEQWKSMFFLSSCCCLSFSELWVLRSRWQSWEHTVHVLNLFLRFHFGKMGHMNWERSLPCRLMEQLRARTQLVRNKLHWNHAGSSSANMQMRIHQGDVFKYKHAEADMNTVYLYTLKYKISFRNERHGHESDNKVWKRPLLGLKQYFSVFVGTLLLNKTNSSASNCSTQWQTVFYLAFTIIIIYKMIFSYTWHELMWGLT